MKIKYNMTYDIMFKCIFSQQRFCAPLLSSILNEEILPEELENLNTELTPNVQTKSSRYDVLFKMGTDSLINLEMQKNKTKYNLINRIVYYACNLFAHHVKKGDYYENKQCILIWFLYFENLFENCIEEINFRNTSGTITFNNIRIIIISLQKRDKCGKIKLKNWLDLMCLENTANFKGDDQAMNDAKKELEKYNDDPLLAYIELGVKEREVELRRNREEAKQEGIKEGLEKGIQEGRKKMLDQVISNLKASGFSDAEIKNLLKL